MTPLALDRPSADGLWQAQDREITQSETGQMVAKRWHEVSAHFSCTQSFGEFYSNCLREIFAALECALETDEDLSRENAYLLAKWGSKLAFSFPPSLPVPEVELTHHGELDFEWYKNPHQVISVFMDGQGHLSYAALIGDESVSGRVSFGDSLPREVIALFGRVYGD